MALDKNSGKAQCWGMWRYGGKCDDMDLELLFESGDSTALSQVTSRL
eukprot:CAMPEP_0115292194 /NCGR_PEP_ID=MMETSP0270-20121206/65001_1 /TAXON_ID=71861 /ORGANISM="Scrippsiella trochoidea, Strain CCMP3099" /LENGTH=46 /DNA_ID= /DNA_START= /DNA_END= /DNA_ORIENTATION=